MIHFEINLLVLLNSECGVWLKSSQRVFVSCNETKHEQGGFQKQELLECAKPTTAKPLCCHPSNPAIISASDKKIPVINCWIPRKMCMPTMDHEPMSGLCFDPITNMLDPIARSCIHSSKKIFYTFYVGLLVFQYFVTSSANESFPILFLSPVSGELVFASTVGRCSLYRWYSISHFVIQCRCSVLSSHWYSGHLFSFHLWWDQRICQNEQ